MADYIQEFIAEMRSYGIEPENASAIVPTNGQFKRFRVAGAKKNKRDGYYKLNLDGKFPWGLFGVWTDGGITHSWFAKNTKELTPQEKKEWKEQREAERRLAAIREQEGYDRAQRLANKKWNAGCIVHKTHPYAVRKGIKAAGLKTDENNNILVPMYFDGQIVNLQSIAPDGTKRFIFAGRKKGCYYDIPSTDPSINIIIICEGYATGESLFEATNMNIRVAFDAGNMEHVAMQTRNDFPDTELFIGADNDQFTVINGQSHNTGVITARKIARQIDAVVLCPSFDGADLTQKPTDWNDYYKLYGLEKTRSVLMGLIYPLPNTQEPAPISQAITTVKPSAPPLDLNWMDGIFWKNQHKGEYDGRYAMTNAELLMVHGDELGGCFVLDEFCDRDTVVKPLPWEDEAEFKVRRVSAMDITKLQIFMEKKGMKLSKGAMLDVMRSACASRKYNPAIEYLDSLVWKGKPLLNNWLARYLGAKYQPSAYLERIAACWWMAAVQRIYRPGTDFHHMIVLEGGQAAGKSSALKTIATFGHDVQVAYFTDRITFDMIDKQDFAAYAAGHVVLEFQELSGLGKKDRNKVKQWITQNTDEYRRPFEPITTSFPRQFVLAGTTNESQYLTDPTGDRRFWPVRVGDTIDIEALKEDREQLWAEAVHRVKSGELYYIKPDDPVYELMQAEQSSRYLGDPWENTIEQYVSGYSSLSIEDIFNDLLYIPKERWDRGSRQRISDVLTKLGWENRPVYDRYIGKSVRKWVKKSSTEQQEIVYQ